MLILKQHICNVNSRQHKLFVYPDGYNLSTISMFSANSGSSHTMVSAYSGSC